MFFLTVPKLLRFYFSVVAVKGNKRFLFVIFEEHTNVLCGVNS